MGGLVMGTATLTERFPFLANASEWTRDQVTGLPTREVPADSQVLRRGDPVEGVFLVTSGSLRIYYLTADGQEATLYRVRRGETCILALTAAFEQERYPAWVETETDGLRYTLIPGPLFRELYHREPSFREFVFQVLSGRVFELMSRLEELGSLRVEQRLAVLLLDDCDDEGVVAMSQARLAAHLGTAREVVFRALRSLAAQNLVTTSRGQVRIVDRAALERLRS
jgi:CRP/FNR family transcriptional regulator